MLVFFLLVSEGLQYTTLGPGLVKVQGDNGKKSGNSNHNIAESHT